MHLCLCAQAADGTIQNRKARAVREVVMAARLGTVLWRLGLILGIGIFVFAWWASTAVPIHSGRASVEDLVLGAIVGAALIVIGWSCRYVLSGETRI